MTEPVIYIGIGFLLACLIASAIIPLVLRRMLRSALQRREAALQWLTEVQTDKNRLRAEFATSTRRFEVIVEQLKDKIAEQRVELGRNGDVVKRLQYERNILKSEVCALYARSEDARATPSME